VETGRRPSVPEVAQQYKAEKNLKSRQSGVVEASK
ncbi:D-alanyl-D-alanine endopeptidase, partial [Pseudomonas chengduensis]|nr:D-alanyl-D-alanine endopeptidase [Pseudomonas chengduensis]